MAEWPFSDILRWLYCLVPLLNPFKNPCTSTQRNFLAAAIQIPMGKGACCYCGAGPQLGHRRYPATQQDQDSAAAYRAAHGKQPLVARTGPMPSVASERVAKQTAPARRTKMCAKYGL